MSFPQNGHRFPGVPGGVPDLGALAGPPQQGPSPDDIVRMVTAQILAMAGLQVGGPAQVVTPERDIVGRGIDMFVALGSNIDPIAVTLIDDDDVPWCIPWPSVRGMCPRPDHAEWVAKQQAAGS